MPRPFSVGALIKQATYESYMFGVSSGVPLLERVVHCQVLSLAAPEVIDTGD